MKHIIVIENVRSAYNTGNIIRTADALGRDVVLSGYTPHPQSDSKVEKTALGGSETCNIRQFWNCRECLDMLKGEGYSIVASEKSDNAIGLREFVDGRISIKNSHYAVVMGNEVTGVLEETMDRCDFVVHIPMQGIKESLNVAQASAIMMRELGK